MKMSAIDTLSASDAVGVGVAGDRTSHTNAAAAIEKRTSASFAAPADITEPTVPQPLKDVNGRSAC